MSAQQGQPNQDQIRQARHQGFANAVAHLPEQRANQLYNRYVPQDQRREKAVGDFTAQIRAAR